MADEIQINTGTSWDKNKETDQQSPDEGAVLKERYLRQFADL